MTFTTHSSKLFVRPPKAYTPSKPLRTGASNTYFLKPSILQQLWLVRTTPLVQNGILWNPLEWGERMASTQSAGEILTIREVAALLRVVEKTIYTMAQKSEIPAFKVRGQWRFKRNDIDAWIDSQKSMAAHDRVISPNSSHTR